MNCNGKSRPAIDLGSLWEQLEEESQRLLMEMRRMRELAEVLNAQAQQSTERAVPSNDAARAH